MVRNVGGTEKGIRLIVAGLLIIAAVVLDLPTWGTTTLSTVGIVALLTGITGYCPAWTLFGINSCRTITTSSMKKEA